MRRLFWFFRIPVFYWDPRTMDTDYGKYMTGPCPICIGKNARCWACKGTNSVNLHRAKELKKQPACTVCKGEKVVPAAGAWVMPGDTDPCHHCGQTGVEPIAEVKPNRSSPFKNEGMGIGNSNNP